MPLTSEEKRILERLLKALLKMQITAGIIADAQQELGEAIEQLKEVIKEKSDA